MDQLKYQSIKDSRIGGGGSGLYSSIKSRDHILFKRGTHSHDQIKILSGNYEKLTKGIRAPSSISNHEALNVGRGRGGKPSFLPHEAWENINKRFTCSFPINAMNHHDNPLRFYKSLNRSFKRLKSYLRSHRW